MGHFQFIPTTLASYGADGDTDGKIDIIDNLGDAMASAGNYLGKLGWDKSQKIARRVILPPCFDKSLVDGKTKKTLAEWESIGVRDEKGGALPKGDIIAGLVADVETISDCDCPQGADCGTEPYTTAYLTYPNFYRIKKWNNSNWYAIAIAELAENFK
jgi:membrane-bound lytic murein transglycosylase B